MLFKVHSKSSILLFNRILGDIRQENERDDGAEDAESRRQIERILSLLDNIVTRVRDDKGEDVCPDESTNLACGCCDTVVLASDGGRAGLGGDQADVVTWADFAKGKEDTEMLLAEVYGWEEIGRAYP
jgi:hypothetical protein